MINITRTGTLELPTTGGYQGIEGVLNKPLAYWCADVPNPHAYFVKASTLIAAGAESCVKVEEADFPFHAREVEILS